jgi:hypothetical protein
MLTAAAAQRFGAVEGRQSAVYSADSIERAPIDGLALSVSTVADPTAPPHLTLQAPAATFSLSSRSEARTDALQPRSLATEAAHLPYSLPSRDRSSTLSQGPSLSLEVSSPRSPTGVKPVISYERPESPRQTGQSYAAPISKPPVALTLEETQSISRTDRRVRIDLSTVPRAQRALPPEVLLAQQADLAEVKESLLSLQRAPPERTAEIVSAIDARLESVAEQLQSVQEAAVLISAPAPAHADSTTQTCIKEAIDATRQLTEKLLQAQSAVTGTQTEIVSHMNRATHSFVAQMDKSGGATPGEQSAFLRSVNSLATQFGSSVSELHALNENHNAVREALEVAEASVGKQEALIQELRDENVRLRQCHDGPRIAAQLRHVQTEVGNMVNDRAADNQLFRTFPEAARVVANLIQAAAADSAVDAAGAGPVVRELLSVLAQPNPDWPSVLTMVDGITQALTSDAVRQRSDDLIREITLQKGQLLAENEQLRTAGIVNSRDLAVLTAKTDSELNQLRRSLDLAIEQNAVLERQLSACTAAPDADRLRAELLAAQQSERIRLDELQRLLHESEALRKERTDLTLQLAEARDRYQRLFSEAADAQAGNQTLEARAAEILRRSEVERARCDAVEALNKEANAQLDALTSQIQNSLDANLALEQRLSDAQIRAAAAESQTLTQSAPADVPRMVKLYQQKADLLFQQLQQRAGDLLALKGRRAEDAKAMIRLQRELDRAQNDLRLQAVRFDAAKAEVDQSAKAIADRDQTIRLLRREIERLRALLAVQVPVTEGRRVIATQQNDNQESIVKVKSAIQRTQRGLTEFKAIPAASAYLQSMMQRQQESLARLERKRRQFKEMEEANQIASLQALQHICRREELEIPEDVVLKLMPRPTKVAHLGRQKEVPRREVKVETASELVTGPSYHPSSYAGTLQQIGNLAGKVAPAVMQDMLRQARRNPLAPGEKRERKEIAAREIVPGLSVLPLRK